MTQDEQSIKALVADMLSPEVAERMAAAGESKEFGAYIGRLAFDSVFGELWMRPGLDRRARSLVTLGILIALRATEELEFHIPAALKNGLSKQELEEVIYHASAYAGFPAASTARSAGVKILAALEAAEKKKQP
jgi:4-carboxymuconolactone decarboxylase